MAEHSEMLNFQKDNIYIYIYILYNSIIWCKDEGEERCARRRHEHMQGKLGRV